MEEWRWGGAAHRSHMLFLLLRTRTLWGFVWVFSCPGWLCVLLLALERLRPGVTLPEAAAGRLGGDHRNVLSECAGLVCWILTTDTREEKKAGSHIKPLITSWCIIPEPLGQCEGRVTVNDNALWSQTILKRRKPKQGNTGKILSQ